MNVEQSMCAASGLASQWERIDWSQCEQRVRRLQARIVKATQEGRHGKVKALQWLLTHSFHGRALAVKRVTHNQGKNTPGVDGAIWSTQASRYKAIRRYVKVKSDANPFDPLWRGYFESRKRFRGAHPRR